MNMESESNPLRTAAEIAQERADTLNQPEENPLRTSLDIARERADALRERDAARGVNADAEEKPAEAGTTPEPERAAGTGPDARQRPEAGPITEEREPNREREPEPGGVRGWIRERVREFRENNADVIDHVKLWRHNGALRDLSRQEQELRRPAADLAKHEQSLTELRAQAERHGFELDEKVMSSYDRQRGRLEQRAEERAEQLRKVTERKAEFEERRAGTVERMATRWEESIARTRERRTKEEAELAPFKDIEERARAKAAFLKKEIATLESHRDAMERGPYRRNYHAMITQQKERLQELETLYETAHAGAATLREKIRGRKEKEREREKKIKQVRGVKTSERTTTEHTGSQAAGRAERHEAEGRSLGSFAEAWNKKSALRVEFGEQELAEPLDRTDAIERIRERLKGRLDRKLHASIDADIRRFERTL